MIALFGSGLLVVGRLIDALRAGTAIVQVSSAAAVRKLFLFSIVGRQRIHRESVFIHNTVGSARASISQTPKKEASVSSCFFFAASMIT